MASVLKRIGAFIVDFLIIMILISMFGSVLPKNDILNSKNTELSDVLMEYYDALVENNEEELNGYNEKINDLSYEISKLSIYNNILSIVIYFLYFIVFQVYNKGQTLGKLLFKIQVKGKDEKEVSFKQLLLRGIMLYPFLFTLIDIILINMLSKDIYFSSSSVFMIVRYIVFGLDFLLIFGSSRRGFHDIIGGTIVVNVNDNLSQEMNDSSVQKWQEVNAKENEIKKYGTHYTERKRVKNNDGRVNRTRVSKKK